MIKVIIAGSRDFINRTIFNNVMTHLLSDIPAEQLEIISGGCRGADQMAEEYAKTWGIKSTVFPAEWDKYGKSAGPIRNKKMAEYVTESENDSSMLIAFPGAESRGTWNMIGFARDYQIDTHIYYWGQEKEKI
jgi:hypothetical protein